MCLDSDKKILCLCDKHVIGMSSRKSKEKYHQRLFRESAGNLLEILFEVCPF